MSDSTEQIRANVEDLSRRPQASWLLYWLAVGVMLTWTFRLYADLGWRWQADWNAWVLPRAALSATALTYLAAVLARRRGWWRALALDALCLLALSGRPMSIWIARIATDWASPSEAWPAMFRQGGVPLALLAAAGWFARDYLGERSRRGLSIALLVVSSAYAFVVGPAELPYYAYPAKSPTAVCLPNVK